jgi:hypothetical protein
MDNLVFEESINSEVDSSEFISKKWIYVNDSNSQNYTSQVVIDSTPLSNAGGYINWQEAYIMMPLVVQLSSESLDGLVSVLPSTEPKLGQWSWALKNSFIQMINSMNVEFNNQNIIQQTPLTNVFRTFKLMTSYSENDLVNNGSNYGFFPDTMDGWEFNIADSNSGLGLCNNDPSFLNTTGGVLGEINENSGIYKRNKFWNYIPDSTVTSQALISGPLACESIYRSCQVVPVVNGSRSWRIYAKLRLKDLNEFFEKAPLLKGSTIRFYLNTNQTKVDFKVDGASGSATYTTVSPQVLGGLTNPLMLLPIKKTDITGSIFSLNNLLEGDYTLSISIFKNNNTGRGQTGEKTGLQACRLYAPVYKFNPIAEQRYLSLAPTKKIEYNDIFQYQFTAIEAGSQFNFLVSNGIANIQSVLVVPLLTASANGTQYNTLQSPFSTSGGTPDPIPLSNFNILVSGVNLFLNNELYDFEQFTQQLDESNQLNGNLTTGLTSGLISEADFQTGMRYYYGNCARQLPSEMGVSRSIQIQGKNESLKQINILVFVEFKRSITIDILTGARIE